MKKPEEIALLVERICEMRGMTVAAMLAHAGVDKSQITRMKKQDKSMPGADKIAAMATTLNVPADFLLGTGVFEKWDLILENKTAVLSSIAGLMRDLSLDVITGVDDLTLARLVGAFSVNVGIEPDGREITVISPFATLGTAPRIGVPSSEALDIAAEWDSLDREGQHFIRGKLIEERRRMEDEKKKAPALSDAEAM